MGDTFLNNTLIFMSALSLLVFMLIYDYNYFFITVSVFINIHVFFLFNVFIVLNMINVFVNPSLEIFSLIVID